MNIIQIILDFLYKLFTRDRHFSSLLILKLTFVFTMFTFCLVIMVIYRIDFIENMQIDFPYVLTKLITSLSKLSVISMTLNFFGLSLTPNVQQLFLAIIILYALMTGLLISAFFLRKLILPLALLTSTFFIFYLKIGYNYFTTSHTFINFRGFKIMKNLTQDEKVGIINHSFANFKENLGEKKIFIGSFNPNVYLEKLQGLNDLDIIEKILFSEFNNQVQLRCTDDEIYQIIDKALILTDQQDLDRLSIFSEIKKSGLQGHGDITMKIAEIIEESCDPNLLNIEDVPIHFQGITNFIYDHAIALSFLALVISIGFIGYIVFNQQAALEAAHKALQESHKSQVLFSENFKQSVSDNSDTVIKATVFTKDTSNELIGQIVEANHNISSLAENNQQTSQTLEKVTKELSSLSERLESFQNDTKEVISKLLISGAKVEDNNNMLAKRSNDLLEISKSLRKDYVELKQLHVDDMATANQSIGELLQGFNEVKDGNEPLSAVAFLKSPEGAEYIKKILEKVSDLYD